MTSEKGVCMGRQDHDQSSGEVRGPQHRPSQVPASRKKGGNSPRRKYDPPHHKHAAHKRSITHRWQSVYDLVAAQAGLAPMSGSYLSTWKHVRRIPANQQGYR